MAKSQTRSRASARAEANLVRRLARHARALRDLASRELEGASPDRALGQLAERYRSQVTVGGSRSDFADAFAQVLTYGLLCSRWAAGSLESSAHGWRDESSGHGPNEELSGHERPEESGGHGHRDELGGHGPNDESCGLPASEARGLPATAGEALTGLPVTHPLIKGFFETARDCAVHEVASELEAILNLMTQPDVAAVWGDGSSASGAEISSKSATESSDPILHLYEHFLEQYDPRRRRKLGVYYTPDALVSFIVSSVDRWIEIELGLPMGLADTTRWGEYSIRRGFDLPREIDPEAYVVQVLDPAAGTGSFLCKVVETIYDRLTRSWELDGVSEEQRQTAWADYARAHLLSRLHGLELMFPSFAISHLKLALLLAERGFRLEPRDRLRLELADTLALFDRVEQGDLFGARRDSALEKQLAMPSVIIGNPPYSAVSANMLRKHERLIERYKRVDGLPLAERKHWLQDDYVKFFAWSEGRLERMPAALLAFVSNHGYFGSPSFRGMRRSLMCSFPSIRVLDLHGNIKKKERAPSGTLDRNVFNIQQGVGIGIFARAPGREEAGGSLARGIGFAEVWGAREEKIEFLLRERLETTSFQALNPVAPDYLFVPRDLSLEKEYLRGWKLTEIFPLNSTGIITARDAFVIDRGDDALIERMETFLDPGLSDEEVKHWLDLNENYAWRVKDARAAFVADGKGKARAAFGTEAGKDRAAFGADARGKERAPFGADAGKNRAAVGADARGKERAPFGADSAWKKMIQSILYRPFDLRRIVYHPAVVWRTRARVMHHMLLGPNIGLVARRQMLPSQPCTYFAVSKHIISDGVIRSDNLGSESLFPLFLYDGKWPSEPAGGERVEGAGTVSAIGVATSQPDGVASSPSCKVNLSPHYIKALEQRLELRLELSIGSLDGGISPDDSRGAPPGTPPGGLRAAISGDPGGDLFTERPQSFGPLEIFAYLVAVCFSHSYRERYAEHLRVDFPRIPLPVNREFFRGMSRLGVRLSAYLLMEGLEEVEARDIAGAGDPRVTRVGEPGRKLARTHDGVGRLYINRESYFDAIPEVVWNFRLGGYPVCYKWLDSFRKEREALRMEDRLTFARILSSIQGILTQMTAVDRWIEDFGGWPELTKARIDT